jgi:hypothetical protein
MSAPIEASHRPLRRVGTTIVALIGLYTATLAVGFAALVVFFKAGAFDGITVLFFRGLILSVLAFVVTLALMLAMLALRRRPDVLSGRDAFSTAIVSLAFNICFLVVVPVTVDRSVSIFVLGEMNKEPDRLYSSQDMSQLFTTVYVQDYQQIDRRMREQTATGNLEAVGDRYRISARGRTSIATAKLVLWLFGGEARLANPADRSAAKQPTAH